jgi:3-methyladenine DNA glycosylase AlkD
MKSKLHLYILPLQKEYDSKRNPLQAKAMSTYMQNLFPFVGISSPERKEIFKQHVAKQGLPEYKELFAIIKSCYAQPEREYHYFAIDLAGKFAKKAGEDFVPLMEFMISENSWWDSVDSTASNCTREFFNRNVTLQIPVTRSWMDSGNMWLKRAALLFQLNYKNSTNERLLYSYILELKDSNEFFIQKAIGWALREYSKTNPESVRKFLAKNALAKLSVREASKYLD